MQLEDHTFNLVESTPKVSDSVGLQRGLRTCIFDQFPVSIYAPCPETRLGESVPLTLLKGITNRKLSEEAHGRIDSPVRVKEACMGGCPGSLSASLFPFAL